MDTTKKPLITEKLLDDLEKTSGLIDIVTQQDFLNVLQLDKAIIYLLVNWSGPERVSRYIIYNAFNAVEMDIPIFKIDCSEQKEKYVEDWLAGQRENKRHFYFGGWGETVLIQKGEVTDFIRNPGELGQDKTLEKIRSWNLIK